MRKRKANASAVAGLLGLACLLAFARAVPAGDPGEVPKAPLRAGSPESGATAKTPPEVDSRQALRDRLEALASELAANASKFGPDAVALQAALMLRSIEAGAVGPTTVALAGDSSCSEGRCLAIEVDSGLFFDRDTTTSDSRLDFIWKHVAEPVLTAAGRFEFSPAALDLVFRYRMQSFADQLDGRADPAAPAQGCRRHVVLPAAVLADLAGGSLAAGELRARAVVGEEILEEDPETVR